MIGGIILAIVGISALIGGIVGMSSGEGFFRGFVGGANVIGNTAEAIGALMTSEDAFDLRTAGRYLLGVSDQKNAEIEELQREWDAIVLDEFGQPRPTGFDESDYLNPFPGTPIDKGEMPRISLTGPLTGDYVSESTSGGWFRTSNILESDESNLTTKELRRENVKDLFFGVSDYEDRFLAGREFIWDGTAAALTVAVGFGIQSFRASQALVPLEVQVAKAGTMGKAAILLWAGRLLERVGGRDATSNTQDLTDLYEVGAGVLGRTTSPDRFNWETYDQVVSSISGLTQMDLSLMELDEVEAWLEVQTGRDIDIDSIVFDLVGE